MIGDGSAPLVWFRVVAWSQLYRTSCKNKVAGALPLIDIKFVSIKLVSKEFTYNISCFTVQLRMSLHYYMDTKTKVKLYSS